MSGPQSECGSCFTSEFIRGEGGGIGRFIMGRAAGSEGEGKGGGGGSGTEVTRRQLGSRTSSQGQTGKTSFKWWCDQVGDEKNPKYGDRVGSGG